jgi:hypothetical protein
MTRTSALRIQAGLQLVVVMLAACAGAPPEPSATWPLACSWYPPIDPPVAECARRNAAGEVVLRPGAWLEDGGSTAVRTIVVEGELLFALASGRTAPALPSDNAADDFVEGLARSPRDGKIGFVDERLELVVSRQWDFAFPFEDGLARVCSGCVIDDAEGDEHSEVKGGRWGYVDREGRVVVPVVHARDELPAPAGAS